MVHEVPMPEINIMRVGGDWSKALKAYKRRINGWCCAALAPKSSGTVTVVLAHDAFIQELNHQYRGKNKPTNVLSFAGETGELGDIVLGFETIKREALAQGKSFAAHTAHLVVHGILHLLGFDHEKPREAGIMEKKEIAILAQLGYANPYEVIS